MSVCIDSGTVLANVVGTTSSALQNEDISATTQTALVQLPSEQTDILPPTAGKNVAAKLVVPTGTPTNVLQKVVNQPVITVLNSSGPLTVVKSLCVTSGVSSAPQFTLVNSAPLTVGKAPTITLLNGPVTVVKAIPAPQNIDKSEAISNTTTNAPTNVSPPTIIENRGHNVFVKNTCPDSTVPDMPQSHKILTASNFPQANVLANVQNKTANGQRNKLKILSNIQMMPGTSNVGNVLLNKSNNTNTQRYVPRSKLIGANGATAKYLNKPTPNNVLKTNVNQPLNKSPQRMVYPTHKSQIKTLTPNYLQKPQGIKTLSPQQKPVPGGQMQRSNSGLRTIPPQRPPKMPNKPNYIGKHAVQAQKMRPKMKNMKVSSPYGGGGGGNHHHHQQGVQPKPEKQLTFNQALTAEIIETLSNKSTATNSYPSSKHYEILPTRYENAYTYQDHKPVAAAMSASDPSSAAAADDKTKSGLDALSLICQAVLLDHNYNATPPPDSPTRSVPPPIPQSQLNGMSGGNSMYSPGSQVKRRLLPSSNSTVCGLPNMSAQQQHAMGMMGPAQSQNAMMLSSQMSMQDEDAASDVSDLSDRKHDTEGEETDTAPEAEAVTNEEQMDHYGDYVTRCICGFLHDDGYMVECDRCKVWQHVQCVVKNKQVPDEYLCEVCDPTKPVEKQKARMIQQQWLRDRQLLAESNKLKKEIKSKETAAKQQREVISDSESSDGEHHPPHHNNNVVAKRRRKSETSKQQQTAASRREAAIARRQKQRRERKTVKRKPKPNARQQQAAAHHHSEEEGGNAESFANHLPQLRQWIEKYEEAVTNHYSPELRARISNIRVNGAHSDQSMQFDCAVQKCRVHTQPLTELKYLVSTVRLAPNTPVVELRGKYMLSTQHRNSGSGGGGASLTTRQHSQRPGPFLFFYRLHKDNTEVCVDTRTYGNSARFVRRSCKPNAELRHCIEKGVLHLYVVSIADVEKNSELTIKHESHDLAVVGTTQIACACNSPPDECAVNKSSIKKNGESTDVHRKRRGRRTTSTCLPPQEPEPPKVKEEPLPEPLSSPEPIKQEVVTVKEEVKVEVKEEVPPVVKEEMLEIEEEPVMKPIKKEIVKEEPEPPPEKKQPIEEEVKVKEEETIKSPPHTPIMTRRSSHYKSDKEDSRDGQEAAAPPAPGSGEKSDSKSKCKKLSREERKLEAILRAIEQMEKAEQRKQEHEAKAQHRRESEPGPNPKEEEKIEPKMKRRRRKGRARTTSTNASTRRNRLNSTDSYMTSGDETMLSPTDNPCTTTTITSAANAPAKVDHNDKAVGLLLALSNNCDNKNVDKSPMRCDVDSNSNSAHSSPETPLSSACLLVQAAVEPLEPGFKFPKTKKGLMNEWLNKETAVTPPAGNDYESAAATAPSAVGFYSPAKNLAALAQAATYCDVNEAPRGGSAKKRWLRQAISEDRSCDSPQSRPDSPPLSEMVAPPKKRRLPRESLSNEASPPSTPTSTVPPSNLTKLDGGNGQPRPEGCVEIVYSAANEGDSPTHQTLECDAVLKERAAQMKQEYEECVATTAQARQQETQPAAAAGPAPPIGSCLLDPRLAREHHPLFANSDHLVGAVEKTLSILGFQERRPEAITPAKRKLSITEYRQRKKVNNNDGRPASEGGGDSRSASPPSLHEGAAARGDAYDDPATERHEPEPASNDDNNSSESFRVAAPAPSARQRSGSTSSSTSVTSSDDEARHPPPVDLLTPQKALSAFNSEPTELERQREASSLRLKKAFGLALDDEPRKPALEEILNCELPPIKAAKPPPSPAFPIPGSGEVTRDVPSPVPPQLAPPAPQDLPLNLSEPSLPVAQRPLSTAAASAVGPQENVDDEVGGVDVDEDDDDDEGEEECAGEEDDGKEIKPNLFYTPDEEEVMEDEEIRDAAKPVPLAASATPAAAAATTTVYDPSGSYVPAFNNPAYSNNKLHISSIDDDARYEGRNPSPPPHLDASCE